MRWGVTLASVRSWVYSGRMSLKPLRIITVGKPHDFWKEAGEHYLERIARFRKVTESIIKDSDPALPTARRVEEEGKRILAAIATKSGRERLCINIAFAVIGKPRPRQLGKTLSYGKKAVKLLFRFVFFKRETRASVSLVLPVEAAFTYCPARRFTATERSTPRKVVPM